MIQPQDFMKIIPPHLRERVEDTRLELERVLEKNGPRASFCLFSGGDDSLTATHLTAHLLGTRLTAVAHINTGIGIPDTREFVRVTCEAQAWRYLEYKAVENTRADGTPDPMIYEEIIKKYGFPGAGAHLFMYAKLKERQIRRLVRDHKKNRKDKILLISGVRSQESKRRFRNVKRLQYEGARVWFSVIHDFSAGDCLDYLTAFKIPRNPVKQYLHMSGECLCGAYAKHGELKEIELWYPDTAAEIRRLEAVARAAGHNWGWEGNGPPRKAKIKGKPVLCSGCGK